MRDSATDVTWITQPIPPDDATFLENFDAYLLPMSGDYIDLNLTPKAAATALISVLEMAPAAILGGLTSKAEASRPTIRSERDPPFADGVDGAESEMVDWHPSYVTTNTNAFSIFSATESEPLLPHPRSDEWETTPRSLSFASSTSRSAMKRAAPVDWQASIQPAMGDGDGALSCSNATTGSALARRAAPRDVQEDLQPAQCAEGFALDRVNCKCNLAPGPSSSSSTAACTSALLPRSASFHVPERPLHQQLHLRRSSYIEPGQYVRQKQQQQQQQQQSQSSPSFFDLCPASSTEGTPELSPAASIVSSTSTAASASATFHDYPPPPPPTAINRRRVSLPGGPLTPTRNYSSFSSVGSSVEPLGSPPAGRSRRGPPPPRSSTPRASVHVSSAFAEMQDAFLQQQSPPPPPQQQYQHHPRHHDMLASGITFTPSDPPRSSFVAPSQMDALYRSASNDSNASSASPNSATSYASAPPLLSPTHADPMMMESPPLLRASSSNGEAPSSNNALSERRSFRRPAPIKIDASPEGRRPPSRLSIEVPPNYLQQQHNRARDGASPYPLPGGLASPLSPYPLCVEAGSTRPMTPTQQAASQREMEQLLGQLDNFLGPEGGGASQSMQQTMSSSPNRPVVPLRPPRGGSHLSIPSRMQNSLSPPASFGIASFEISGVTLNEEELALLDDAEFNNEVNDASKPYPASAPAWQTTFNLGPQGQYGAPHPSQQAYSSRSPQYTAPLESHQMGWSHGAAYQCDNATNTTDGPPTPTTPRNQMTAMPSYQQRQSVDPGSLSSPVRRRRSSDGLSAHPTHYTAAQHPNRMSYPYFEQQPQQQHQQPPQYQTQRAPYTLQEQYSYGYGAAPPSSVASSSRSSYSTHHHPSSMPRSMASNDSSAQPLSPVSSPKSPTKRARTSPPKATVPLPLPSPVRPPLSNSTSSPAVTTLPSLSPAKKLGGLVPMFINYSANDKKKLLGGVAPSGSSKKKREEAEAAARAAAAAAAAARAGQRA